MGCCDTADNSNPDYCTIHQALGGKYVAAHMRYWPSSDEYRIHMSWGPMSKAAAMERARHWAITQGIDFRE